MLNTVHESILINKQSGYLLTSQNQIWWLLGDLYEENRWPPPYYNFIFTDSLSNYKNISMFKKKFNVIWIPTVVN